MGVLNKVYSLQFTASQFTDYVECVKDTFLNCGQEHVMI